MEEKKHIGSLFDRIAFRYDFLNHLLSLNIDKYWRRKAVKTIKQNIGKAERCLDVAIGTGDLALEVVRQEVSANIQGIDLSSEMMRIGAEKVTRRGLQDKISFLQASALDMPFEDNSFDLVTCAYGVRNFSDPHLGLSEMYRVLKPNRKVMILEFSYPTNRIIAWAYDLYFSFLLPSVAGLIGKDKAAYRYLNRSVRDFVWGDSFAAWMRQAGFREVSFQTLTFGITTLYTAIK